MLNLKLIFSVLLTVFINYLVPFLAYALLLAVGFLPPVENDSPGLFLLSLLILNTGIALSFVLIFYVARQSFAGRWLLYGLLWWLMFTFIELGQAIGPDYTWPQAVVGLVAALVYFPLSAFGVNKLIGLKAGA
ncbi:MAG: hypothetical protein JW953_17370 [Anaerolineae bacterium]|nr:hypothetical protein [Anaerolineae bacterium]